MTDIEMHGRVRCFCPMGNDWYSADVSIRVSEPRLIPDYCNVDSFLASLDGTERIIEDVCADVHGYIKAQTRGNVTVSVKSGDAVHLPVEVTIAG